MTLQDLISRQQQDTLRRIYPHDDSRQTHHEEKVCRSHQDAAGNEGPYHPDVRRFQWETEEEEADRDLEKTGRGDVEDLGEPHELCGYVIRGVELGRPRNYPGICYSPSRQSPHAPS